METELNLIKQFEADAVWLKEHKDSLRKDYKNQFVAVKNEEVIAANPKLDAILKELENKGVDAATSVIEFISEKKIIMIY